MHRGRFSATNAPFVSRKRKENHIVGLLTRALQERASCGAFRLPSFPVTGFRHETLHCTYSGGTVRDSHPIILFSCLGSSPSQPRRGLFGCLFYNSTVAHACQAAQLMGTDLLRPHIFTNHLPVNSWASLEFASRMTVFSSPVRLCSRASSARMNS